VSDGQPDRTHDLREISMAATRASNNA